MYADNTLTPKEAVRLCALGTLALRPMCYSALADAIRHFVSRVLGPSLDVMGTSLELLKYEGLIEAADGADNNNGTELAITEAGRAELRALLTANIRLGATELNKLIVALSSASCTCWTRRTSAPRPTCWSRSARANWRAWTICVGTTPGTPVS